MVIPRLNQALAEVLEAEASSSEIVPLCAGIRRHLQELLHAEGSPTPGPLTRYVARAWRGDAGSHCDAQDAVLNALVAQLEVARASRSADWKNTRTLPGLMRWWKSKGHPPGRLNLARALLLIIRADPSVRAIGLQVELTDAAVEDAMGASDDGAEQWVADKIERVVPLLPELPHEIRRVMTLLLQGLTANEIGAELGKTADTVRRQIRRGVQLLRLKIEPPTVGGGHLAAA